MVSKEEDARRAPARFEGLFEDLIWFALFRFEDTSGRGLAECCSIASSSSLPTVCFRELSRVSRSGDSWEVMV